MLEEPYMKPQLASDAVLSEIRYSCIVQPKIDGVRALNVSGILTGRSLDPFEGYGITEYWSKPEFVGLDGEMILGDNPASSDRLCSLTTGAMGRFKGVAEMEDLHFYVFDWLPAAHLPYIERYKLLKARVEELNHPRVHLVPMYEVFDSSGLAKFIAEFAAAGYEGTIVRNPNAPLKEGRPTKKGQQLLRVKPWADAEILVTGITEGEENHNEATINSLGRTERSSAKDGKVPNGMVGSIQGTLVQDIVHPNGVIPKGTTITVSKGRLTQEEARYYFENQNEIVGHIVKFQYMEFGIKNLPRFPVYVSHRLPQDL